jgi:hypothetical protein
MLFDAGLSAILEAGLSPGAIFVIGDQSESGDSQTVADAGTGQSIGVAFNASELAIFSDVLTGLLEVQATYLQILTLLQNWSTPSPPPQGKYRA